MGPFVVISRFKVANGVAPEVRAAFLDRPHLVDDAPGFIAMEVLSPTDDPDEFWLLTRWTDETSFRVWHRSHSYRESHKGIPAGLKLDPTRTRIMTFTSLAT